MTSTKNPWIKPVLILFVLPFIAECAENFIDLQWGDGDGTIASIATVLTVYQLLSILLGGIWLSKFFSDKGRNRLSRLFFTLTAIFAVLLIAEVGARIYYKLPGKNHEKKTFRLSQPAPYKNSPYFSPAFIESSFSVPKYQFDEKTGLLYVNDTVTPYCTITNHLRKTCDQPAQCQKQLLVFGGSTVFCSEVPDSFTVCSYLQREINQIFPGKFCVRNYGMTSVNTAEQFAYLERAPLDSGDVVIFYDGVNDIFNTIRDNNPDGTIAKNMRGKLQSTSFHFCYSFYQSLREHSKLVELLFYPSGGNAPAHLSDPARMQQLTAILENEYLSNISRADSICKKHGALFVHFLQPNIFYKSSFSAYENDLLKTQTEPGAEQAFKAGNPVLSAAQKKIAQSGIAGADLSGIFNVPTADLYLDFCHVTEKGNALVAKSMAETIRSLVNPD